MLDTFLDTIKRFEGFAEVAKWDYAQFTNGYGTRALHEGEKITPQEADRRFREEIAQAERFVEKHAAHWDAGTKAALTSLTFNAGTRWAYSGLGEAVRAGNVEAVKDRFVQYVKAGGEVLPGLVARRQEEVRWIGWDGGPNDRPVGGQDAGAIGGLETLVSRAQAPHVGFGEVRQPGISVDSDAGLSHALGVAGEGLSQDPVARAWSRLGDMLINHLLDPPERSDESAEAQPEQTATDDVS